VDADVRAAILKSHLHELPPEVVEELMTGAVRMKIPAGAVTHRPGEPARHLELVISGVVRGFVTAPDGRTMTVRYCRPGALIGAVTLFATRFTTMPAAAQALVDAELLKFSPAVVRRAAARDPRVAQAFLSELSERVLSFIDEIPGNTFATVRQRVARHLLDLAAQRGPGREAVAEIVVPVSQQELADAVGTVREVVVRVLRELRQDGVVRTERDHIVILDPARLVPGQRWN
jgi:CRP/FNR family transcriptional regulator, cyclic AMP receptor protein